MFRFVSCIPAICERTKSKGVEGSSTSNFRKDFILKNDHLKQSQGTSLLVALIFSRAGKASKPGGREKKAGCSTTSGGGRS